MQGSFKSFFLSFFVLLLILPIINAAPPFIQEESSNTAGLEIEYPPIDYLEFNKSYDFHFHVFNTSNGFPMIENLICFFHLYDNYGSHLLELNDSTVSHVFDYSFDIGGENFSRTGSYDYVIQCNNSRQGGFAAHNLEVTKTGNVEAEQTNLSFRDNEFILLYFVLIVATIFLLLGVWKEDLTMASLSGILYMISGVFILINGFENLSGLLNNALGFVLIGVGFYISVVPHMDFWEKMF